MRQCPWIFQAPGMSAAIGTKNKMRTRVERREKGSFKACCSRSSDTKRKFIPCRSFPRPAMAQTARVSSVDMTDITPTHTAAEMSDIRHHTQHPKSRICSRRLPEAYQLQSFCRYLLLNRATHE